MLLSVAFLVFTLAYVVYSATSLGRINTLPPLPDQYKPNPGPEDPRPVVGKSSPTPLERKLEQAFGRECKELKWPVLLELNSKSMVMAAGTFEIVNEGPAEQNGRVKLEPMSLALFGKKKNDGREVEINTLKCNQAYIRFDRPVTSLSPSELNGRKVVEAQLFGNIVIVNNRRTALRDDDLSVTIDTGPLVYLETKQIIRTSDHVHLRDGQLNPPKADIVAKGMEMDLETSAPPRPGTVVAHKPKNESISSVKRIVLKQDVTMHLYVAGQTPFPNGDKTHPAPGAKDASGQPPRAAAKPPSENSHVVIRTPGRFRYDIFKDHDMAYFDVPEDRDQPSSPQDVTVERINDRLGTNDQLVCKHLELRIKRRDGEAAPAGGSAPAPEQGLEIETAHATGPEVTLTSDVEKLDAHGNDFFYDATKKLTILKGKPYMEAEKDESLIQAPELQIQDVVAPPGTGGEKGGSGPAKTFQQVHAKGPGVIHMTNKTTGKKTTHAYWNDKLTSTRDGTLDLLILTGEARFVDEEQEQSLKAETLKVWLLAEDKNAPPVAKPPPSPKPGAKPGSPEQARRPHKVEALRNIVAHSRELNVHDASRLVVRFTDVPLARMPNSNKPAAKPPENVKPPENKTSTPPAVAPLGPAAPAVPLAAPALPPTAAPAAGKSVAAPSPAPVGPNPDAPAKPAAEPPRPIDLSARSIEADVLRCDERTALDHLWTEGKVLVHQEPNKAGEQGVDIKGGTLNMKCYAEGNVLEVSGDYRDEGEDLAQLKIDKMHIVGPDVHIDQALNKVWVYGPGAMNMQSNTSLEGKPLGRTVPLQVFWSEDMVFQGEHAVFNGNIQAEQESARLACQHLQVFFDRYISLKEGGRGDQPAKIRSLVGDKDVRVEDKVVEKGKLVKYQKFQGSILTMNTEPRDEEGSRPPGKSKDAKSNDANVVHLSGPGNVRILQRGGANLTAPPGKTPANQPAAKQPAEEQEMKLTYVSFEKRMDASNQTNTAKFWGSVRVLHLPCEDEDLEIDLDAMLAVGLPPGAMHLRCNLLTVQSHSVQGKNNQEMVAHGQVEVQAKEFYAKADHMTYNEAKDQIIFEADPGNVATLAKYGPKGAQPDIIRGQKILYIRSTGAASIPKFESLSGN
jgi:lipopolysaccharide export system protein LptA